MVIVPFLFLLLLKCSYGNPVFDELMEEHRDDTAVVESVVREARAVGPTHIDDLLGPGVKKAFLHTYGDKEGEDGELQGYSKKMNDKGKDGYKHFDSFHKKDSDKYGYEIHSEFGKENKQKVETGSSKKEKEGEEGDETKNHYIFGELQKPDKKKKAVEDFDSGFFQESSDADGDGEGNSEHYEESENNEDEGDSERYTSDDGEEDESAGYEQSKEDEEDDY